MNEAAQGLLGEQRSIGSQFILAMIIQRILVADRITLAVVAEKGVLVLKVLQSLFLEHELLELDDIEMIFAIRDFIQRPGYKQRI